MKPFRLPLAAWLHLVIVLLRPWESMPVEGVWLTVMLLIGLWLGLSGWALWAVFRWLRADPRRPMELGLLLLTLLGLGLSVRGLNAGA